MKSSKRSIISRVFKIPALRFDDSENQSLTSFSGLVTYKTNWAISALKLHTGRGPQEAIFAEAKSNAQLEYIPVKKLNGNKVYCLSAMMAHNLHREMQMHTYEQEYGTTVKRRPLWTFQSLATFRKNILQRAGRLIYPQG